MARPDSVLVTCEHGGNHVPRRYRRLFEGQAPLLASHRGWDAGALLLAQRLAGELRAPLIAARTTRLLVDLNRSPRHPALFSAITRGLGAAERAELLARYYAPYVESVASKVAAEIDAGRRVIHLSAHSFVPVLHGRRRRADVGLLYDPQRAGERVLSIRWRAALLALAPGLTVRRNYPYRGTADGLTTALRRRFAAARYVGIEVELNQAIATDPRVRAALARSASVALQQKVPGTNGTP